jgi:hypothetical protein
MFLACRGLLAGVANDAPSASGVAFQQYSAFRIPQSALPISFSPKAFADSSSSMTDY